ncbi:unnamed protein product [Choristocarpus tenellus]
MKLFAIIALFVALVGMASAFVPNFTVKASLQEEEEDKEIGAGGMADTRNPDPKDDPDPRKSISAAPSFEDYLKSRQ